MQSLTHIFFSFEQRTIELLMTLEGGQGAPHFRRFGRELISKPAISLTKKCLGEAAPWNDSGNHTRTADACYDTRGMYHVSCEIVYDFDEPS